MIGYLERFEGIKEIPATWWISDVTEDEWIPQHRIKYFTRTDKSGTREVVWDRDKRIDKIFSGLQNSIDEVDLKAKDGGAG